MASERNLGRRIGIFQPLLGGQFEWSHVDHAPNRSALELVSNPCQVLRLFWVGSVNGAPAFIVSGSIPNATLKANTNSMKATCFHSLTEGLGNPPTVIGNHDGTGYVERRGDSGARFDLDLPATRSSLMGNPLFIRILRRNAGFRFRGGDCCCGFGSALHFDDVSREMIQRWVVGENEILVDGQTKPVTNLSHNFRLFHGINAQFPFEVLVEFNEVSGITGMAYHHRNQNVLNLGTRTLDCRRRRGGLGGRWCFDQGFWSRGRFIGRCRGRRLTFHSLDVANHVVQRRMV